jgi:hypothetical protein
VSRNAASESTPAFHDAGSIKSVAVTPAFFNPSLGQSVSISSSISEHGMLSVSILDREGHVIRKLSTRKVDPGTIFLSWDGKDEGGHVVPDEAYSLHLTLAGEKGQSSYDPSRHWNPAMETITRSSYSRIDGTLSYRIARASLLHIEAGQAVVDPKTHRVDGPVLKTIVDSEPRSAGSVLETWNGFDQSGTVFVPDLPHFVVSIVAVPLPENSLITVGNREETFLEYASGRQKTKPALRAIKDASSHANHRNLNAFENHSPKLRISPAGPWDAARRSWQIRGRGRIVASLEGPTVDYFLAQPTFLQVYCDENLLFEIAHPKRINDLTIDARSLTIGPHRVVVNWVSRFGPSAVNSIPVDVTNQ